jgi:AhpD family alkylhydroperoxidase
MSAQATRVSDWYATWSTRMKAAKAVMPDAAKGFAGLHQNTMKANALSELEKEFVALGIGIAVRCDNCIFAHVEQCIKLGATAQHVLDVASVAVMMGGGPCYTYATSVVEALVALGALPAATEAS